MNESKVKLNNIFLTRYAFLALCLSFLGLPLYLHLPKFYHDNYGLSLANIGISLFILRIFDAFIDPILGILSYRFKFTQKRYFIIFALALAFFYNAFFHLPKLQSESFNLAWFITCTTMVYLFFSLIFINYYNLGVKLANDNLLIIKLASLRELFGFLGLIIASILPFILIHFFVSDSDGFIIYGVVFFLLILFAVIILPKAKNKISPEIRKDFIGLLNIYNHKPMRSLIILFFINSFPLAISSNLFSFYVDQVLVAKSLQGMFLASYLFSAAFCAFLFSSFFKKFNKINSLIILMIISLLGFSITYFLNQNNHQLFYLVCILSGFGLGGELVILSALAGELLKKQPEYGNIFFALWTASSKIALAIAAGIFLPLISTTINFYSIEKIIFFYALIPLGIKLVVILLTFLFKFQNIGSR